MSIFFPIYHAFIEHVKINHPTSRETIDQPRNRFSEHPPQRKLVLGDHFWLIGGFCLLLAVLFIAIASKSSPLYPFNDWTDANTFFTVGKGMFNGQVPYRDLFEQKGPLLYFLFGLGYLVSETTFLGIFLLEVLSFAVFLFFGFHLAALFVEQKYALLALPVAAGAILNLRSFGHGGSAEQLSIPLITISMYFYCRYFKAYYPKPMPPSWLLLNGSVAGCVLWIKYAFIGWWAAWIGAILVVLLVNKQIKDAILSAAYFLGGLLASTVPWLIYFGMHGAIGDWLEAYFVINLTAYPMQLTLRERIMVPIDSLQRHLSFNPIAVTLLVFGAIIFTTNKKYLQEIYSRLGLIFGAVLLVIGVYGGGRDYMYYFLIFSPFILFGLISLLGIYAEEYGHIKSKLVFGLGLILAVGVTFGYTLRFQRNTYMLTWDRESLVQYRYAIIIQQTELPTLLNYGFQDSGFYTAANIFPNTRFFQSYNIDLSHFPHIFEEQHRYIKDGVVEYIVMRFLPTEDTDNLPIPHLYENYELIASETQLFGDTGFIYLLFQKAN